MSNVSELGAQAYMAVQDATRRLPEVQFSEGEIYIRSFLKIACKKGQVITQADAEFIHDEYPSSVLIGELIGEPVYNPLIPDRQKGLQVPKDKTAVQVLDAILKTALGMDTDVKLEGLTEAHINSFLEEFKKVMKNSRPEVESQDIETFKATLKGISSTNFDLLHDIVYNIVSDFSNVRTDIRSWTAPYQTTTFHKGRGGFARGSITPREADDGNDYNICYNLGRLMTEYSKAMWRQTDGAKAFSDPESDEAVKAWRRWCQSKNEVRLVWGYPNLGIVHFCLSGCTDPKYQDLKKDPATNRNTPDFYAGYYTGSLGTSGKTNKIVTTAKTGTINDDPDYFTVVLNYTTGKDKTEAGKNMNVQPLVSPGRELMAKLPTIEDIHKFMDDLINDKKHTKVRLYDTFDLMGNIKKLREYVIANHVVDALPDPMAYKDTLENILGITDSRIDVESITNAVQNEANNTVQSGVATNAVNAIQNAVQNSGVQTTVQTTDTQAPQVEPQVQVSPQPQTFQQTQSAVATPQPTVEGLGVQPQPSPIPVPEQFNTGAQVEGIDALMNSALNAMNVNPSEVLPS